MDTRYITLRNGEKFEMPIPVFQAINRAANDAGLMAAITRVDRSGECPVVQFELVPRH